MSICHHHFSSFDRLLAKQATYHMRRAFGTLHIRACRMQVSKSRYRMQTIIRAVYRVFTLVKSQEKKNSLRLNNKENVPIIFELGWVTQCWISHNPDCRAMGDAIFQTLLANMPPQKPIPIAAYVESPSWEIGRGPPWKPIPIAAHRPEESSHHGRLAEGRLGSPFQ